MLAPSAVWMIAARLASQGACRGVDPELFFPVGSSGPALHQIAQAKAVCAGCLVRDECLSYAVTTGQSAGIWGGTSEEERRKIRSVASATVQTALARRSRLDASCAPERAIGLDREGHQLAGPYDLPACRLACELASTRRPDVPNQ